MSMETLLETSKVQALRDAGLVKSTEVVKVIGDIYVAEDVVSGTRRVLQNVIESMSSSNRRILRD